MSSGNKFSGLDCFDAKGLTSYWTSAVRIDTNSNKQTSTCIHILFVGQVTYDEKEKKYIKSKEVEMKLYTRHRSDKDAKIGHELFCKIFADGWKSSLDSKDLISKKDICSKLCEALEKVNGNLSAKTLYEFKTIVKALGEEKLNTPKKNSSTKQESIMDLIQNVIDELNSTIGNKTV